MAVYVFPVRRRNQEPDVGGLYPPPNLMSDWIMDLDDTWKMLDTPMRSMRRFEHEFGRMQDLFHGIEKSGIENPYVTDDAGNRKLKLEYDVSGYKPEEIKVKTKDNRLIVHAKHVEEGPGRRDHAEFTRVMALPEGFDVRQLKSVLTKDGLLQIEGPAPPAIEEPKETEIQVHQE